MSTHAQQVTDGTTHNGVIDVSDLATDRVQQYAREVGDAYLERKGGRTFLVTR